LYTSVVLLALSGILVGAQPAEGPTWFTDYGTARKQGRTDNKPLAVLVASGPNGFEKVSQEGKLSKEVKELLAQSYVCVFVDAGSKAGQRLAADFALGKGLGIVLSDRSGELQAFYHEGKLTNQKLAHYLQRFAAPDLTVRTTLVNDEVRVSYYSPSAPAVPPSAPAHVPSYQPSFAPIQMGGFGGFGGGRGGC
jgi:hypothetical protein